MKAYFVFPDDDYRGYVVHAATPEKARYEVHKQTWFTWEYEYRYLRAHRYKKLDDKPITLQSLIDSGMDMTFEGEPIEDLDVECQCGICKKERENDNR